MSEEEKGAYILGTEEVELHRLGLQHQVWDSEAREGWRMAEFSAGQTILDLGCGPGFCTSELGYVVGNEGKVIAVERSEVFTKFIEKIKNRHRLNIEIQNCDFKDMQLVDNSLDGAFCRWALAWIDEPAAVIQQVSDALKPGGAFVVHEYYDWSTFQTEPTKPNLKLGIAAALRSFKESPGNINVGRKIPELFYEAGIEVISVRPMAKIGQPGDLVWQWPKSFLKIYLPKLVAAGYLTKEMVESALEELEILEYTSGATILCPSMVEVIGIKM